MIETKTASKHELRICLNRPDKKNALTLAMMHDFLKVLKTIPEDIQVVILEGKGSFFCSGLDLEDVSKHAKQSTEMIAEIFSVLAQVQAITLASIKGGAFAGGLGLIAACDLSIATNRSQFALPELQRGLVPAFVHRLLRFQCSPRFLNGFILTGEKISAAQAQIGGIINWLVEESEFDSFEREKIQNILKSAPKAMKIFKKQSIIQNNWDIQFSLAHQLHEDVLATGESKEGIQAFLEKRFPNW